MNAEEIKVGARITFPFGKGEKEGVVERVFQKTVYLLVDFPHHAGKRIRRKMDALTRTDEKPKKKGK